MPAGFEKCRRAGGKIRRFTGPNKRFNLKSGEWRNICYKKTKNKIKTWLGHKHRKKKK